jgi:predicted glycosyltransferase
VVVDHVPSAGIAEGVPMRALFFVFDGGIGVGHLRRLACVAKRLQGRFSCLIVTGQRAAAHWFVPEECEYVHVPNWDSLLEAKAGYWGRKPFMTVDVAEATRLRSEILAGVARAFQPDVIFVEHLPLGAQGELARIIAETPCLKYMVTRGVLNETEDLRRLILGGRAHQYLSSHYHRVLVASDRKVFDFSRQYNIAPDIRRKTLHTGYVTERIPGDVTKTTRDDRGLAEGDTWVVASAGGGQLGEALIESCCDLARTRQDVTFDVVLGPRSNLPWTDKYRSVVTEGNLRLHRETRELPYLHASADLVISSGGYNSLLETLQGNAKILCFPKRPDHRDEQYRHTASLKRFVDIDVSTDFADLPVLFDRALASLHPGESRDRRRELDFDGAASIEKVVLEDLGLSS